MMHLEHTDPVGRSDDRSEKEEAMQVRELMTTRVWSCSDNATAASAANTMLDEEHAVLMRDLKGSVDRESYLPAILRTDEKGTLLVEPLKWGGSSDFVSFARAQALINVPAGTKQLAAGSVVRIVNLPH